MDLIPDDLGGNLYVINGSMQKLSDAGAAYKDKHKGDDEDG